MLFRSCPYPYIFETPVPAGSPQSSPDRVPHPFILRIPWRLSEEADCVELTLFGRAIPLAAFCIRSLVEAIEGGVRGMGTPVSVSIDIAGQRVDNTIAWHQLSAGGPLSHTVDADRLPPIGSRRTATLRFITPVRLKYASKLATPELFSPRLFFHAVIGRIEALMAFHQGERLTVDFRALLDAASSLEMSRASLRWQDWTRFSARQNTKMAMGGLLGEVTLHGPALETLWPYLFLASICHVGKGTSMGLGQVEVELKADGDSPGAA